MTDANGNELVPVRSLRLVKVGIAALVLGFVALVALGWVALDTRGKQKADRVVVQRFSKSPCANMSAAACRRLLITPEYLAKVLPRALRLTVAALERERDGGGGRSAAASVPRRSPGQRSSREPRSQGSRPPASPGQPEPSPASGSDPPSLVPVLPGVPRVCVDATVAGVCVGG